jgi:hypothetical protein
MNKGSFTFSLCHGIFGNCETLLYGAAILSEPTWRDMAESIAGEAIERFQDQGAPWPSGALDGSPDPSLLLGDAGIGYHFLRLANPETPSVLLPTTSESVRASLRAREAHRTMSTSIEALTRGDVDSFFATTRRVIGRLLPGHVGLFDAMPPSTELVQEPPSLAAFARTLELIERLGTESEIAALIEDAFLPERMRFESALALRNHHYEILEWLTNVHLDDPPNDDVVVGLSRHTILVSCSWDWDAWLADANLPRPKPGPVSYVIYRRDNLVRIQRIGRFAFAVFSALREPRTLQQAFVGVGEALGVTTPEIEPIREKLKSAVIDQIRQAQRVGIVVVADSFAGHERWRA